jgi:hypothetical protein
MLIICQFPLIDYRSFLDGDSGRVPRPDWLELKESSEFVRNWGNIPKSGEGGVGRWLGEERRCLADGALRIPHTPEAKMLFDDLGACLLFRTFHFDGYAAGKFEIGIDFGKRLPADVTVTDAVRRFLALPVEITDPTTGNPVRNSLGASGELLAASYLANTTLLNRLPLPAENAWWVERGDEMVLVELRADDGRSVGLDASGEFPGTDTFPSISYHVLDELGRQVLLWAYRRPKIESSTASIHTTCRSLRIDLLRVNAELVALRSVLRQIYDKRISLDSENNGTFHPYFYQTTSRILRWQKATTIPVIAIANDLAKQASSAKRDQLLKAVNSIMTKIARNTTNAFIEIITNKKVRKPGKRMILFLMASPVDQPPLGLDAEIRDIRAELRKAKRGDLFSTEILPATRVVELWEAILDFKPHVVHFACHGTDDAILLEDDERHAFSVTGQKLANYFAQFPDLECVVLNACYSETQASEIVKNVAYVVGMQNQTPDKGAHEFAVSLYSGIGAGQTYEQAFNRACAKLGLEGLDQVVRPVLKVRGV